MNTHIPQINGELDKSKEKLTELAERLPTIRTVVSDIRTVYDSGRNKVHSRRSYLTRSLTHYKAQNLVADLSWLDTDFYERWRRIIFTSSSPVSWRWKAIMRITFAVSFVVVAYLTWIALGGVYRAHRQRLVWGERLMS